MSNRWMRAARAAVVAVVVVGLAGCARGASPGAAPARTEPGSGSMADSMAGMNHGTVATMPGMEGVAGPIGDGTRASEFGFTLVVKDRPAAVGRQPIRLVVTASDGSPVREAEIEQTKKMHLIVARGDLSGYQHLHPELAADGTWSVEVNFFTPGRWHLIADVTPIAAGKASARVALGADVDVPGAAPADTPLPAAARTVSVDGYDVALEGTLRFNADQPLTFTISRSGTPATDITEYLGAGGHLVALQQGTLGYTHIHPDGGPGPSLTFTARAPHAGRYRLFLQFATGDTVHTAAFTVDVA